MFCESESGWGEKRALEEGCGAILCEPEVSYGSFTKAIVALADTIGEQRKVAGVKVFLSMFFVVTLTQCIVPAPVTSEMSHCEDVGTSEGRSMGIAEMMRATHDSLIRFLDQYR